MRIPPQIPARPSQLGEVSNRRTSARRVNVAFAHATTRGSPLGHIMMAAFAAPSRASKRLVARETGMDASAMGRLLAGAVGLGLLFLGRGAPSQVLALSGASATYALVGALLLGRC